VNFNADEPGAVLESDATPDGKSAPWYVLCEAPCTQNVYVDGSFRVSGPGYHPSRAFRIPDDQPRAAVTAEMQTSSIALPMALTIVGGAIATVGLGILAGGVAKEEDNRDGEPLIISGGIVGGAGAVIGIVGVVMLLVQTQHTESRAHVTF